MAILPGVTFVNLLPKSYLSVLRSLDYVRMDDVRDKSFPWVLNCLFWCSLPLALRICSQTNEKLLNSREVFVYVHNLATALSTLHTAVGVSGYLQLQWDKRCDNQWGMRYFPTPCFFHFKVRGRGIYSLIVLSVFFATRQPTAESFAPAFCTLSWVARGFLKFSWLAKFVK